MFYCVVNVYQEKINHIYEIYDHELDAIILGNRLRFNLINGLEEVNRPKRIPGLPMVIYVVTDDRKEVEYLISLGRYEVIQEYEYPMFA